jgi:plastocyanin
MSVVVALVVAVVVACDRTSTSPGSGRSMTVGVSDNYFDPMNATISVGDTVYWLWGGGASHNVFGESGTWCGFRTTGLCFRVFTVAGTFPYSCTAHNGMDAQVIVH